MKTFLQSRKNAKNFIFSIVLNAPIMKKAKFLQFFVYIKKRRDFSRLMRIWLFQRQFIALHDKNGIKEHVKISFFTVERRSASCVLSYDAIHLNKTKLDFIIFFDQYWCVSKSLILCHFIHQGETIWNLYFRMIL